MKKFIIIAIMLILMMTTACTNGGDYDNTPPAEVPPTGGRDSVPEMLLEKMSIEEKIGQLFIVGIENTKLDEYTATFLKEHKIGGVLLFGRNIKNNAQVRQLTEELQALKTGPGGLHLFIAVDQEGGRVNRLPGEHGAFPSAKELASGGDENNVMIAAEQMAIQLKGLGINLNFAPVLDINSNKDNPVIGDRAFGDTPDVVTKMGLAFIEGTLEQGIIPVAKHFPGHGDTGTDSHTELPVINHSIERLDEFELIPFKGAIKNDVPMIMVAHILLPEIDKDYPATLSEAIIEGILRERLGFSGVVVSDDLDMGAITGLYSISDAATRAIKAGVDMLIIGHNRDNMSEAYDAIVTAVAEGYIKSSRIDEAVVSILKLKEQFGLIDML